MWQYLQSNSKIYTKQVITIKVWWVSRWGIIGGSLFLNKHQHLPQLVNTVFLPYYDVAEYGGSGLMKNPGGDIPFLNSRQTILIHGKWRENSESKREKIIFQLCSLRTEGLKWKERQNPREQLQQNFPPKRRGKLSAVVEPVMAEKQETQGPQHWVITKTKQLII